MVAGSAVSDLTRAVGAELVTRAVGAELVGDVGVDLVEELWDVKGFFFSNFLNGF